MKDKRVTIILISVSGNVMEIFSFKSSVNISRKQKFKDRLSLFCVTHLPVRWKLWPR